MTKLNNSKHHLVTEYELVKKWLKVYFNRSQFQGFNTQLAYYLRLTQFIHVVMFFILTVFKYKVIFTNPLSFLFVGCIFGTLLVFSHRVSLMVSSGSQKSKKRVRLFLLFLLFCYIEGTFGLIVLPVIFFWRLTLEKHWQSDKDIYLGKFHQQQSNQKNNEGFQN